MPSTIQLIDAAHRHADRTAIVCSEGIFTYQNLLDASANVATALLAGAADLDEARVALLIPPGFDYAATQWGIWRSGGVAVPLGLMHPPAELEHVLDDARISQLVVHPDLADRVAPLAQSRSITLLETNRQAQPLAPLPDVAPTRRAMILYTSGTTSKPKGVVTTHANIAAQVQSLVEAWQVTPDDRLLHVLPLHHIHGIINVLTCSLWVGASCEFLPRFDAPEVCRRFARGETTVFMAVPTIYSKLITAWEGFSPEQQAAVASGCRRIRLMVSGSAALPVTTLQQWQDLTGHVLLERYGMTEIGMGLSNPLHGTRTPGHVGVPLPGVEVRRVDDRDHVLDDVLDDDLQPGQIEVRGPGVFLEYCGKPQVTRDSFHDGWFRTGDVAVVEEGSYRILGRSSVDIIKTGGYKVSALEIEEVLRTHPDIRQCAVVGIPDPEWGQRVAACIVTNSPALDLQTLRAWGKHRLAVYKVPTMLLTVDDLPRNAMGKVQKPAVIELFQPKPSPPGG